jgi:hypothetical protein
MNPHPQLARWRGFICLLLSCGISALWGVALAWHRAGGTADLKAIYYGARCVMHHRDPYKTSEFQSLYLAEGGKIPTGPPHQVLMFRAAVFRCINLPTTLLLIAPFALLAWGPAYALWMVLVAASLTIATFLAWELAGNYAPRLSLFLLCFMLANREILFTSGNAAGLAVSFCVIAVWCFLRSRCVPAGIILLAIGLVTKPQDVGFVWLYFLLAGGTRRKRALQTLVVVAALCLPAALWVSHAAPQWAQELHANLLTGTAGRGLSNPGPTALSSRTSQAIFDLQAAFSIFRNNPHFYNPVSYLLGCSLILVWIVVTLRKRLSPPRSRIGLAAISALTFLPVYHRIYDAELLMLMVPACAMLWAAGGARRWLALAITAAAIFSTSDVPVGFLVLHIKHLPIALSTLHGKMEMLALQPFPLILLAAGCFYLWVYARYNLPADSLQRNAEGVNIPATASETP